MDTGLSTILEALPRYEERLSELSEIMLANLVMIAEIPAATFSEQRRTEFLLEQLGIRLESNLILMGSAQSLGRSNIEGIRFFLNNTDVPISARICVEGVRLGRLSYSSIGMLRGEIHYDLPEEYDWTRFGAGGAIVNMNEVINRVLEIPLPRRPRTTIVFNSIESGAGFNTIPTRGSLQFEVRSESGPLVAQLGETIENIAAEVSSHTGTDVTVEVPARRPGDHERVGREPANQPEHVRALRFHRQGHPGGDGRAHARREPERNE